MTEGQIFTLCLVSWFVGIGVGVFAYWLWTEITDGELRQAHHTRADDDEHAIGYPEDSKLKAPEGWPKGGLNDD